MIYIVELYWESCNMSYVKFTYFEDICYSLKSKELDKKTTLDWIIVTTQKS